MTDMTTYWILPEENNAIVRTNSIGISEQYDFFSDQWIPCEALQSARMEITSEDVKMIRHAFMLAKHVHNGQTDKAGAEYILHPFRVSQFVKGGPTEITIALLHDVVEDTDTTLEDLREEGFPENVVNGVDAVTRRPEEARDIYLIRVKNNPSARLVKLADLKHNSDLSRILDPKAKDLERVQNYQKEIAFLKTDTLHGNIGETCKGNDKMKRNKDQEKPIEISGTTLKHISGGDKKIPGGNSEVFGAPDAMMENPFLTPHDSEGE